MKNKKLEKLLLILKNRHEEICSNCAESIIMDDHKLYCPIKEQIVEGNFYCEKCNS